MSELHMNLSQANFDKRESTLSRNSMVAFLLVLMVTAAILLALVLSILRLTHILSPIRWTIRILVLRLATKSATAITA